MDYLIMFLMGVWVGIIIAAVYSFSRTIEGSLKIDQSKPEKDTYRLEIDDLDTLPKKKQVILKVDVVS